MASATLTFSLTCATNGTGTLVINSMDVPPGSGQDYTFSISILNTNTSVDYGLSDVQVSQVFSGLPNGPYFIRLTAHYDNGSTGSSPIYSKTVSCSPGTTAPTPPVTPAPVYGCTNRTALNYNAAATADDGSCVFATPVVRGCTNKNARNYNALATVDDGSCAFGPATPVRYNYPDRTCLTVVFNEPLDLFVTEQTYRAQVLLTIDGQRQHSLPLPGQSGDAPVQRWLWEHNAGPEINPLGTLRFYGRTHPVWVEVIVTQGGPNATKNVDNLVLVANDELPTSLVVEAPEQGTFTQNFVLTGHRLSLTCRRSEQLTYAVIQPPKNGVWGGRTRASWVRLRLYFAIKKQLRLSALVALLRESVS